MRASDVDATTIERPLTDRTAIGPSTDDDEET